MKTNPGNLVFADYVTHDQDGNYVGGGLTKREYFAAMAMQGVINLGFKADGNADPEFTARDAVKYADALIAELNTEGGGDE
jgi:hypothetical protein